MKIAILSPAVVGSDAVANDVIGMWSRLRNQGYDADIFAGEWNIPGLNIRPVAELQSAISEPEDLLIYHFCAGWDEGLQNVVSGRYRKVIKYHNVTPPEFYEGVHEGYTSLCRAGRAMLGAIARIDAHLFLSCSDYSKDELIRAGAKAERNFVLSPFHQVDRLLQAKADLATLDGLNDGKTNILTIGRVVPNKGHLELLAGFEAYHRYSNPASRLIVVGKKDPRLNIYIDSIYNAVAEYGLEGDVYFSDQVSDEQLKAYLLGAHAFAITSLHEGFCVPLVEAMAHHLPIVAYASSAVGETVGGSGLVWPERDPCLLAASFEQIASDQAIAERLGHCGWQRYDSEFRNEVIADKFFDLLTPLLRACK